ncbi:helix-turn-helix transcriptional regulator [Methylotenera sp.]|uniref:helix-turn-helix domain-containing protein n=1 Tax=Methylotenera sp. TaxID=2051956 RepID=UPI002ED8F5DC
MKKERKALGTVLRRFRKSREFTQENLSFESGVDRNFISLIELGESSPSWDTICLLCKALNITSSHLAAAFDKEMLQGCHEKQNS